MKTEAEIRSALSSLKSNRDDEDYEDVWGEIDAEVDMLEWVLGEQKIIFETSLRNP